MAMIVNEAVIALSLSVLLWIWRLQIDRQAVWPEIRWNAVFLSWTARGSLWQLFNATLDFHNHALLCAGFVAILWGFLAAYLLYTIRWSKAVLNSKQVINRHPCTTGFIQPLVFPSRTSHVRFFPQKHSFSFSYLLVGIPVGWRGSTGSFLSVDENDVGSGMVLRPGAWFGVKAVDYLHRGYNVRGLKGKLENFLETRQERLEDYPHVYLITAPRFLGYSFNPVSFWYLYNEFKELKAMILEVNNTFDERRIYFLKDKGPNSMPENENKLRETTDSNVLEYGRKALTRFTSSWAKDFHVSPFNSRKGAYSVTAENPLERGIVDNTITLKSSKGHPKLVARIFSTRTCIDPLQIGTWETSRLIAAWWWVGFLTFPRILREAAKLFFSRKLHVWYRPEVLRESIGRQATEDERAIERCFRSFLQQTVEKSDSSLPVKYTSPMSATPLVFYPRHLEVPSLGHQAQVYLDLKVTTPYFYAQIVRSAHLIEFCTTSWLTATPKSRTFYTSDPNAFVALLKPKIHGSSLAKETQTNRRMLSSCELLRWRFLRWLRKYPGKTPSTLSSTETSGPITTDIRSLSFPQLDEFVMQSLDTVMSSQYRRAVIKVLASDIVALGHPALIDLVSAIVKILLSWSFVQSVKRVGMLNVSAWSPTEVEISKYEPWATSSLAWGILGLHLWWGLKEIP